MGLIVKRRVTLDLSRRGHQVTVPFSVGDRVAHEVIFTLRDGSELIELPPGVTAAITIKNGYNGTGCVDACVIDHVNNTITYTPTVEALSIEGNIECTMHVFDADGAVIGGPTFIFAVSEGDNANTESEVRAALKESTGWDIIAKAEENAKKAAAEAERAEEAADRAETGGLTIAQAPGDNDKAVMSQKAATKAFVQYNDVTSMADPESIPRRGVHGEITVGEPTEDNHATTKGFVLAKIVEKIAEIIANAPSDLDTLKEIADYIASDKTDAAKINSKLSKHEREILDNRTAIENLPELVQETGDREDAVMSQKAAAIAFVPKVEKSEGDWVYIIKGGVQGVMQLQYGSPTAYSLAARIEGGALRVGTPKTDADATTKKYVDDGLVKKLDIVNTPDTANRVYGINTEGANKLFPLTASSPQAWAIPIRNDDGQFAVGTPTADNHAANKNYVDLSISEALGGSGSGNVTLYRHTAAFGIYNKGGLTSNVQGIDFAFSYISTDGTPFPETVEGIYNWIMANGFLPCSGYINEDGKTFALYGLHTYGANDGYRCLEVFTENHSGGAGIHDSLDEPNFTYAGIDVYYHTTTQI